MKPWEIEQMSESSSLLQRSKTVSGRSERALMHKRAYAHNLQVKCKPDWRACHYRKGMD